MFGLGCQAQIFVLYLKAKRLLGYEPQTGFEDGLTRVHAGVIENWGDIGRSAKF